MSGRRVALTGVVLLVGCNGMAGMSSTDGAPPLQDDTSKVCQAGKQCCTTAELTCSGDPDDTMACSCFRDWTCDSVLSPKKCQQSPADVPDGKGGWTCTVQDGKDVCSRSGSAVPAGKNGWVCTVTGAGVQCQRAVNTPDGGAGWSCSYSGEFKTCTKTTVTTTGADGGVTNTGGLVPGCPKVAQKILVIDFRCGWWGEGGGSLFTKLVLSNLQDPCVGTVNVTYEHFVAGYSSNASMVMAQDWNIYSQIWLLSGSPQDPTDLPVGSSTWQAIQSKLVATKSALFLGGGDGFVEHAIQASKALGLGTGFGTSQAANFYVFNPDTIVASELTMGVQLHRHDLFAGGITSIADEVRHSNSFSDPNAPMSKSDYLIPTSGITIIGNNTQNQPCIGVSEVTTAGNKRRVVMDAGMQRFYATGTAENKKVNADTLLYLQNIVVYLSMH
jgi:hypothetical protein